MNYADLKARMAGIAHRTDLTPTLPAFIEDARLALNRRFGLTLVAFTADTDTNAVLTDFPDLYVFAGMRSLFEYLNDGPNAQYYGQRFATEAATQNITAESLATDKFADSPPQIVVTEG